jgi:hypothetical protein
MSVVFYSYNTAVRGEETPPAALKEDDDIFKDQIVVLEFSAADAAGDSVVLANARIAKLGQREFVVGDGYAPEESDEDWYAGMLMGVPCDGIVRFESMTPERYKEYLKMMKEHANE